MYIVLNKSGKTGSPPRHPTVSTGSTEGKRGAQNLSLFPLKGFCSVLPFEHLVVLVISDGGYGVIPLDIFLNECTIKLLIAQYHKGGKRSPDQYSSQMVYKGSFQYQNLGSSFKYQNFNFASITYHNFIFSISQIQPQYRVSTSNLGQYRVSQNTPSGALRVVW